MLVGHLKQSKTLVVTIDFSLFFLSLIQISAASFQKPVMHAWTTGKNCNIHVSLLAGLSVFLLLSFCLTWGTTGSEARVDSQKNTDRTLLPHFANPFRGANFGAWKFDVTRDGDNYGLSPSQCSAAFPKLYTDIEEMVSRRRSNHISKAHFDSVEGDHVNFSIRAMIYNGGLYIVADDGRADFQSRGFATLHAINRALLAYPDRAQLPNCEFRVYLADYAGSGEDSLWVYTKPISLETENLWLMPDFGMYDWPEAMIGSYSKARRDMRVVEEEVPWAQKTQQLVWRGIALPHYHNRVDFVRVAHDKPWAVVSTVSISEPDSNMIPVTDFCRWMFVADVERNSWSGGAKYKHNCHSVFVSSGLTWREIYTGALVDSGPEQNWVSVRDDWSNLEETLQNLIANPAQAKMIADNSVRTLRDQYLTPAAEACYWRRLIQGYALVSFEPEFFESDNKTWRGTPFSSVAVMGMETWQSDRGSLINVDREIHARSSS